MNIFIKNNHNQKILDFISYKFGFYVFKAD